MIAEVGRSFEGARHIHTAIAVDADCRGLIVSGVPFRCRCSGSLGPDDLSIGIILGHIDVGSPGAGQRDRFAGAGLAKIRGPGKRAREIDVTRGVYDNVSRVQQPVGIGGARPLVSPIGGQLPELQGSRAHNIGVARAVDRDPTSVFAHGLLGPQQGTAGRVLGHEDVPVDFAEVDHARRVRVEIDRLLKPPRHVDVSARIDRCVPAIFGRIPRASRRAADADRPAAHGQQLATFQAFQPRAPRTAPSERPIAVGAHAKWGGNPLQAVKQFTA